jgi:hypothetical protein
MVKMARAIIESADQPVAPKRLLLGSDAYRQPHHHPRNRSVVL